MLVKYYRLSASEDGAVIGEQRLSQIRHGIRDKLDMIAPTII